ncbi:unnamed protein product [Tuber melanosporum]|uniref:(Perigord truffle) hypothetical protein n=1 Tax=Tuber melanosporum (strain Mel28) TaxID=656061 RepID=D5GFZ9_TUBMM|nr:uncharacterized protein GSTUM_00007131001 [Tuber melanosporum]CAZ83442.1 unnamed protein product [Tuber melanosporum]
MVTKSFTFHDTLYPHPNGTTHPILAGVCGTNPFPSIPRFLTELCCLGFIGVQKFLTNLEEPGMGFGLEVEMIRTAHEMDMLTCPYVFTLEQAADMVLVGADIIVAHIELTTKGRIGAGTAPTAPDLDGCVIRAREIWNAAVAVRSDVSVVCYGAPVSEVDDVDYVLDKSAGVHEFFGACSMARLPIEVALEKTVKDFKGIIIKDSSVRGI